MSRTSHLRCSTKKTVLKKFAISIGKNLSWSLFIKKLFQRKCFRVNIVKLLRTPILKNICERLHLNVVLNSNEEQDLLVKLDEMGLDIIMFYVYLYQFGIIILVFYSEAVIRRCSLKSCF